MKIYKFKKHKKKYNKLFEKEKKKILKLIPEAYIEHIGSTSIPDIGGKPVIDMLIGVKNSTINNSKNILKKLDYNYKETIDKRSFFVRNRGYFLKKRYHLHLTKYNNDIWKKALKFKNNLLNNKKLREQYKALKIHGLKLCKGDPKFYRQYKDHFIKEVLRK
ncbi:GrpB family protein [Candidatus Pacearchaeota archaeon]|nr:GrpB family protein [Candidatus Pacearchaeota archaeon]